MRNGLLIYNPAAGQHRSDSWVRHIVDHASAAGIRLEERPTSGPGDATRIAAGCRSAPPDLVVVAGGDGTVGEAAAGLLGSTIPLMILPYGTANVLAREFGIGTNPRRAERVFASTRTRPLTGWRAGDRIAFMWMGIGLDARVLKHAIPALKRSLGRTGIAWTAIAEFLRYDFPRFTVTGVTADGSPFAHEATFAVASNLKRYGGDLLLSPQADPEDDLLDVTLFTGRSRTALTRFALDVALTGLPTGNVIRFTARTFSAHSSSGAEVDVQLDGDYAGLTPATLGPAAGRTLIAIPIGGGS